MPACAAFGCNHRPEKDRNKTFHKFPWKNEKLFKIWLDNINREFTPSKSTVICSDHFEESKFDRTGQTTRLRENAAPTIFATLTSNLSKVSKPRRARRKRLCLDKLPTNVSTPQAELSLRCKDLKNGLSPHKLPGSSTITQSENTLPDAKSCVVQKKKTPQMLPESTSTPEPEHSLPCAKRRKIPQKRQSAHTLPANVKSQQTEEPSLPNTKHYKVHKKDSSHTLPASMTTQQLRPLIPCSKCCKAHKRGLSPQTLPVSMTAPKTEPSLPCTTISATSTTVPQEEPSLPCTTPYISSTSMTVPQAELSLSCTTPTTSKVANMTAIKTEASLTCTTPHILSVASPISPQEEPSLPYTAPCTSSRESTPSTLMGSHSYGTVDHFVEPELEHTGPNTRLWANVAPNISPTSPSHSAKDIRWCKKRYKAPKERSVNDLPESTTPQEEPSVPSAKSCTLSTESSISTIMDTHSYAIMDSPRRLKQKLNATLDELQKVKKKLKSSEQSKRRLSMRVNSLKEVIASLRSKKSTSKKGSRKLRDTIILHFPPLGLEPKPHNNNNNNNNNYDYNYNKTVNEGPLDGLPESSVILIQC